MSAFLGAFLGRFLGRLVGFWACLYRIFTACRDPCLPATSALGPVAISSSADLCCRPAIVSLSVLFRSATPALERRPPLTLLTPLAPMLLPCRAIMPPYMSQ